MLIGSSHSLATLLLSLAFFLHLSFSVHGGENCFGYGPTSGMECVGGWGTCQGPDLCMFMDSSAHNTIVVVGRNTNSQLGLSAFDKSISASNVEVDLTGRLFVDAKLTQNSTLLVDFNGVGFLAGSQLFSDETMRGITFAPYAQTMNGIQISTGDDFSHAVLAVSSALSDGALMVYGVNTYNNLGLVAGQQTTSVNAWTVVQRADSSNRVILDVSVGKYSGCFIDYVGANNITLFTSGLLNLVLSNRTIDTFVTVDVEPKDVNTTSGLFSYSNMVLNSAGGFGVDRCFVGMEHHNLFVLKDNGDLMVTGERSIVSGVQPADASVSACAISFCISPKVIAQNVTDMKCSVDHCVALTTDGKVLTWGDNSFGKLCNGAVGGLVYTPTKIADISTFGSQITSVTVNKNNIYLLTAAGYAYGCGSNFYGQIGTNDYAKNYTQFTLVYPYRQYNKLWALGYGAYSDHMVFLKEPRHCAQTYNGTICETPLYSCNGISADNSSVCSGRGTCLLQNNCVCNTGYSGSNCEIFSCNGILSNNSAVCSGRGTCVSSNVCSCPMGYYGLNCETPISYTYTPSTISRVYSVNGDTGQRVTKVLPYYPPEVTNNLGNLNVSNVIGTYFVSSVSGPSTGYKYLHQFNVNLGTGEVDVNNPLLAFKMRGNTKGGDGTILQDFARNSKTGDLYIYGAISVFAGDNNLEFGDTIISFPSGVSTVYAVLARLNSTGVLQWYQLIQPVEGQFPRIGSLLLREGILSDGSDDRIFIVMDSFITDTKSESTHVLQYNALGNMLWKKSFIPSSSRGNTNVFGTHLTIDSSGSVLYLVGSYQGDQLVDNSTSTNLLTNSLLNIFQTMLIKINVATSDVISAISFGGSGEIGTASRDNYISRITIDYQRNVYYLTGAVSGSFNFGNVPVTSTNSLSSSLVAKVNLTNDQVLWAKTFGPSITTDSHTNNTLIDAYGNIFVTGVAWYAFTVDNQYIDVMSGEGFVKGSYVLYMKADTGVVLWAKSLTSLNSLEFLSMGLDPFGNVMLGGTFSTSITFGSISQTFETVSYAALAFLPLTCNNVSSFGPYCQNYNCYGVSNANANVCSGHGSCISPDTCVCQGGYKSSNCSMATCYGNNAFMGQTVCSGHGSCISNNYCSCSSGFFGNECQYVECFNGKHSKNAPGVATIPNKPDILCMNINKRLK